MTLSKTGMKVRLAMVFCLALVFTVGLASVSFAAPQRVVVLPFTANAKGDVSYLVKGVRDMLASRLAWRDKVTVIEPDLVAGVMKQIKPPYTDDKARELGKKINADAVVYGSITAMGSSVSVDARVIKVKGDDPALTAFVQAADMDQVIPQINEFAKRINAEIFRRPDAIAAVKKETKSAGVEDRSDLVEGPKSPAEQWGGNQGRAVDVEKLPPNISPLNPLFMKALSGVESDRYWRSPKLKGNITSLIVDDIDLDGKMELLVLFPRRLRVYRLSRGQFNMIYEFKNGPRGLYYFVDTADLDGDGRPEVFVTSIWNEMINSFVLVWGKGGFAMKAKDLPWYFRSQPNPIGKGKIVWGQGKNIKDPFSGPVYRMQYKNGTYETGEPLILPEFGNIFNFARADLNGSGKPLTVMIGPGWRLGVYRGADSELYRSGEIYGGSAKYIEAPSGSTPDSPGDEEVWHFLPTRLVLNDLDNDGRSEIVVVRNKDSLGGITEKMKFFYQGTIFSLYWNGMSMIENWRTPRISGYVTDYTISDVGNVGRPALVMSVVRTTSKGIFDKGSSHVVAFTLKPKVAKGKRIKKNKGL